VAPVSNPAAHLKRSEASAGLLAALDDETAEVGEDV
jgi:hypothetical protein